MAYQVVRRQGGAEEILGIFPRRENALLFRDTYVSRRAPFWVVLRINPEETVVYDQEDDVTLVVYIR